MANALCLFWRSSRAGRMPDSTPLRASAKNVQSKDVTSPLTRAPDSARRSLGQKDSSHPLSRAEAPPTVVTRCDAPPERAVIRNHDLQ